MRAEFRGLLRKVVLVRWRGGRYGDGDIRIALGLILNILPIFARQAPVSNQSAIT